MRALDLFCGAGGASMGLHRAGFEVVGVDIKPQPRYPFEFVQADAMTYPLEGFDFIWASPPCQAFTALRTMKNARPHPDLLTPMRERLIASGIPYVIENVPGAPMFHPLTILCGTMFGLGSLDGKGELQRHRIFEHSFPLGLVPKCRHGEVVIGCYGGHARDRRRAVTVTSKGGGYNANKGRPSFGLAAAREAMGIDWMNSYELSQAIPPAYSEYIANAFFDSVGQPLSRAGRDPVESQPE